MKSYDEELAEFAHDMEERPEMFRPEAGLPLEGRRFDDLTQEEFLEYLHRRVTRLTQEVYANNTGAAAVIGMQTLFDITRRRRNLGPDLENEDRYSLEGLEKLRGRPGLAE